MKFAFKLCKFWGRNSKWKEHPRTDSVNNLNFSWISSFPLDFFRLLNSKATRIFLPLYSAAEFSEFLFFSATIRKRLTTSYHTALLRKICKKCSHLRGFSWARRLWFFVRAEKLQILQTLHFHALYENFSASASYDSGSRSKKKVFVGSTTSDLCDSGHISFRKSNEILIMGKTSRKDENEKRKSSEHINILRSPTIYTFVMKTSPNGNKMIVKASLPKFPEINASR